jgi:hypothetical protein
LLSSLVTGNSPFPKRLQLKTPTSAEISLHFDEVRDWISELRALPHCRLELRQFKHRQFGDNAMPHEVWIDSMADALALLAAPREMSRAVTRFELQITQTRQQQAQLLPWLAKRPLRALELAVQWPQLLQIVSWLQTHPRPGIYLRQIDITGIHSKFIEQHRGVLAELLELSLPADAIDAGIPSASTASQFALRYGFRDKPLRIRFRMLDAAHAWPPGHQECDLQDITLDAASFSQLGAAMEGIKRIFITENEINFLAFPSMQDSLVIFGAGYGFDTLAKASWLASRRIYYWGDIDTHGFAILHQLRSHFGHVLSLLMDRDTLFAHQALWGEEAQPTQRDLGQLSTAESALYDDLRDNRIGHNLRLEQELISYHWLTSALAKLA